MEFIVCAVKDEAMEQFLQPIFCHTREEAKRHFAYQLSNNPVWKMNSEQFTLYQVGVFDSTSGSINGNVDLICKGVDILPSQKGE